MCAGPKKGARYHLSLPAGAGSTSDGRQAQRGPVPGGEPHKGAEGQGRGQNRHPASCLWTQAPAPAQASQVLTGVSGSTAPPAALPRFSPSPLREAPVGCVRFRKFAGKAEEASSHIRCRDATSAYVRTNASQRRKARSSLFRREVAW